MLPLLSSIAIGVALNMCKVCVAFALGPWVRPQGGRSKYHIVYVENQSVEVLKRKSKLSAFNRNSDLGTLYYIFGFALN